MDVHIAVIGGSGFYQMDGLTDTEEKVMETPFGSPSEAILLGTLAGQRVAFLTRHGRGHRFSPTELNVRANIYALKSLGVEWIISVSAVGSLREAIKPRHFVIPDQLFDYTKTRTNTFFGDGLVAHVAMDRPFCPVLSKLLYTAAKETGATVHQGGIYLCIEGPQFSTRAESQVYRRLGFDVIGMTAAPEAKLAREAEICYSVLACSTDYDCWHPEHDAVTVEIIVKNLLANVTFAQQTICRLLPNIPKERTCHCVQALKNAIITHADRISPQTLNRLGSIVNKYLG